jgi:DNA modification methylase
VTIRVVQGHAPEVLSQMAAESVHLVCTSPPYFQLRSYGTEPQLWPNPDGTPLCADGAHEWSPSVPSAQTGGVSEKQSTNRGNTGVGFLSRSAVCARCGAWRGELGQEPTVDRYVADLVSVFDAVRRVLRRDGLCWVNLSGSYFNNPGGQNGSSGNVSARAIAANGQAGRQDRIGAAGAGYWLKPLDFVDTPGLFAHAMQRAGWYWRADICLVKRSPLPESVQGTRWERCRVKLAKNKHCDPQGRGGQQRMMENPEDNRGVNPDWLAEWADCPGCDKCSKTDGLILRRGNGRPTRAWERFLVFAKAPGAYFDSEAVREPLISKVQRYLTDGDPTGASRDVLNARSGGGLRDKRRHAVVPQGNPAGRNLRDWQFWPTTGGVGGLQHYAAFPLGLPDLAIRASTSEKCCGNCGAPWARVVERTSMVIRRSDWGEKAGNRTATSGTMLVPPTSETTGWRATCACGHDAPVVPAVVLDPFVGSGTTLIAADRLGRDAIGIDLKPQYIDLAAGRTRRDAPLFTDVEVEGQAAAAERRDATHRDLFSLAAEEMGTETEAAGG